MKTISIAISMLLCVGIPWPSDAQSNSSPVIEGGKLVVELFKAIGSKREATHNGSCKDSYADICIENQSAVSISVALRHRQSGESREVVVLPAGRECSLQIGVGVWTFDLRIPGSLISIRKGDLMIEGCNNMTMIIK